MKPRLLILVLAAFAASCSGPVATPRSMAFTVDAPVGDEAYTCFAFAANANEPYIHAIRWTIPDDSSVIVHHATLYAVPLWLGPDVGPCWDMPTPSTGLHAWVPGTGSMELPNGMALVLPSDTTKYVIQVHALRSQAGAAAKASVSVDASATKPAIAASWLVVTAPIPAIRPRQTETSSASCTASAAVHVGLAWPHMHRIGKEFHGSVLRGAAPPEALVDVTSWNFGLQRAYATNTDLAAGDRVQTTCVWENPSDQYVFGGPKSTDEMCHQALLVWPAENAKWTDCP